MSATANIQSWPERNHLLLFSVPSLQVEFKIASFGRRGKYSVGMGRAPIPLDSFPKRV